MKFAPLQHISRIRSKEWLGELGRCMIKENWLTRTSPYTWRRVEEAEETKKRKLFPKKIIIGRRAHEIWVASSFLAASIYVRLLLKVWICINLAKSFYIDNED